MKSSDNLKYPQNLNYDWIRTLFGPRPSDSKEIAIARPIAAGITFAVAELPWSMPWQNIKSGVQIDPAAKTSMVSSAKAIKRARGYAGFFSGAVPDLGRQVLRQIIRMPCVTYLPNTLKPLIPQSIQTQFPLAVPVMVGLSAAAIEVCTTLPLEGLKTYLTTKNLTSTEALRFHPLQGFAATASRQMIAWPSFFVTNEILQNLIKKHSKDGQVSYAALLAVAPINSTFFIGIPNVFDVVKTHQQGANASKLGLHEMKVSKAIKTLYKQGGFRALGCGAIPSIIQRTPTAFFLTALPKFIASEKNRNEEPPSINEMIRRTFT